MFGKDKTRGNGSGKDQGKDGDQGKGKDQGRGKGKSSPEEFAKAKEDTAALQRRKQRAHEMETWREYNEKKDELKKKNREDKDPGSGSGQGSSAHGSCGATSA